MSKPDPRAGENNRSAKLTQKQVDHIRSLLSEGRLTQVEIAALFGVAQCTVSFIKTGKAWATHF